MNLTHVPRAALAALLSLAPIAAAQQPVTAPADLVLLRPARVFDGDAMHEGWVVRVGAIASSRSARPPASTPPAPSRAICPA